MPRRMSRMRQDYEEMLGADPTFGPTSPEQLYKQGIRFPGTLTPDEARAAKEWEAAHVSVPSAVPSTALVPSAKPMLAVQPWTPVGVPFYHREYYGRPFWQLALLGVAGLAIGVGVYSLLSDSRGRSR